MSHFSRTDSCRGNTLRRKPYRLRFDILEDRCQPGSTLISDLGLSLAARSLVTDMCCCCSENVSIALARRAWASDTMWGSEETLHLSDGTSIGAPTKAYVCGVASLTKNAAMNPLKIAADTVPAFAASASSQRPPREIKRLAVGHTFAAHSSMITSPRADAYESKHAAIFRPAVTIPAAAVGRPADPHATHDSHSSQAITNIGKSPLSFEANHGQADSSVDFIAQSSSGAVFLTPTSAVFTLTVPVGKNHDQHGGSDPGGHMAMMSDPEAMWSRIFPPTRGVAVHMRMVGANAEAAPAGRERLPGIVNYYIGNDPSQWHANIPTFGRVEYQSVYPGIDVVYYGVNAGLEYDFVVAPGADPSAIKLNFAGADQVEIDPQGDLILYTAVGAMTQSKPVTYQDVGNVRQAIPSRYVLNGDTVKFELGAYDHAKPVVIDPVVLGYSTYFGGSGGEIGGAIAVAKNGEVFLSGGTNSADYPTLDPEQPNLGGAPSNAFLSKFTPDGSALLFSTYLGGSGSTDLTGDTARAIAIDSDGSAIIGGATYSEDFPVLNAIQPTIGGGMDAFLAKFGGDGALVFSTFLGGTLNDYGYGVAVNSDGRPYITGATYSSDFPTTATSFQPASGGGRDAFIAKLSSSGSVFDYSTYVGGSADDASNGIDVDANGRATIVGDSWSTDYPTMNAYQSTNGGLTDIVITQLSPEGSNLEFSTYLGGANTDRGYSSALDSAGNVFVTAHVRSVNLPVVNAIQSTYGGGDGDSAVAKLSADGSTLLFSTYIGGSDGEIASHLVTDPFGNVVVSGLTQSHNFPITANAYQSVYGGGNADAFIYQIKSDGSQLLFSTFHGGTDLEHAHCIDVDKFGNVWVSGHTDSRVGFPTVNPIQGTKKSGHEAWLAQIKLRNRTSGDILCASETWESGKACRRQA